jgi:hypothetical protein
VKRPTRDELRHLVRELRWCVGLWVAHAGHRLEDAGCDRAGGAVVRLSVWVAPPLDAPFVVGWDPAAPGADHQAVTTWRVDHGHLRLLDHDDD